MKVLVFIDYYLPGFKAGGPLQSIANMITHLGDDIDFDIVTRDRDLGDARPYETASNGCWQSWGKARVRYVSSSKISIGYFRQIMRAQTYDWVYLNSFFSPLFTILPLIALASLPNLSGGVLIAPRGEFSPGALALKPLRKSLYRTFGRVLGLWNKARWHASTELEAHDIQYALKISQMTVRVATDLPRIAPVTETRRRSRSEGAPLRLVFLSRISPMKNLLFALDVLKAVKSPVTFAIYGPIGDQTYWRMCQGSIAQLPLHVRAHYVGPVDPADVVDTLSQHDLFFLPTLGENYGHVIVEALQAGLPILISDQTPWRDLKDRGIGLDLALTDTLGFARFIDDLAGANQAQWSALRSCIAKEASILADLSQPIEDNRALFFEP